MNNLPKLTAYCDHIALLTQNHKRLEKFYINKLGFRKEKEEILPKPLAQLLFAIPSKLIFVKLLCGKIKLEIFAPISYKLEKAILSRGYHHWGFRVPDREKLLNQLRKSKVKVILIKRNKHKVYFVKDPDNNYIEIRYQ